jgi:hypothetical protein
MPAWFAPAVGLLVGFALRTFLPYLATGFEAVKDAEDWGAWPPFKPSYLVAFLVLIVAFGVTLLTVPGALAEFLTWTFFTAVAFAYAGQDVARQIVKVLSAQIRSRR